MKLKAEVISIGDEITSGQRLDTNSQWLSQQLGDLGVEVAFHTTVGDVHQDNVNVFRTAANRVDIIVSTGGLGPTADDLTREAIAVSGEVELDFRPEVVDHIRQVFARYSREMPESNIVQAYFPAGSTIIDNPEGTAPGIDFTFRVAGKIKSRVFALPGVPAEMKQMWFATVGSEIQKMTGETRVIHHHVLHCFGVGESQAESMLPDMILRGREPKVGITASAATISLRVTAHDLSAENCLAQMQPTIQQIREIMGDLVYGENGQELEEVVRERLLQTGQSLAIVDIGLHGDVARHLIGANTTNLDDYFKGSLILSEHAAERWLATDRQFTLVEAAQRVREEFGADVGVAIGPIQPPTKSAPRDRFALAIANRSGPLETELIYAGHSAIRHIRSVKQVLNQLRLRI